MPLSLSSMLAAHGAENYAFGASGKSWMSYSALRDLSKEVFVILRESGVGATDRVAMGLESSREFLPSNLGHVKYVNNVILLYN